MATVINNAMLEAILAEIRPLIGRGKVADYIPALASVSGDKLGIAISTVDGQHFAAGDAHERFSIQSISSPPLICRCFCPVRCRALTRSICGRCLVWRPRRPASSGISWC
ncbi:glutaminase [Klebsiella pneumoniae]|nr:glutaminase [Klebsiella pneumoniae]